MPSADHLEIMADLEFVCPITEKSLKQRFFAEQVTEFAKRGEPVAVWCPYCERSHLLHQRGK